MIFLKIYSWNKIKRKAFIGMVLLAVLLGIRFLSSDWQEVAVFNALKEEVIIVITPSNPSKVFINGEEIQGKTPFIYKGNPQESMNIKVQPIGNELPVEKNLSFEDGKLYISEDQEFWDHLSINEWPNQVYEILINLPSPAEIDIQRDILLVKEERMDLDNDNDLESLRLVQQGQYYFMQVDNSAKVILKDYQEERFQWIVEDMNEDGIKEIIIKGSFGESHKYIEIFQYQEKQIKRIFWEHGDDIAVFPNGRIQIGKRVYDTVNHYSKTFYQWENNEYKREEEIINWWQGKPDWPSTPSDTIEAFFEAYQLGLMEEAKGYLVKEHQNLESVKRAAQRVEKEWRNISPPLYYFLGGYGEGGKIYMAFTYDTEIHSRYNQVRVYEIELEEEESAQGPWKIKEIVETKGVSLL